MELIIDAVVKSLQQSPILHEQNEHGVCITYDNLFVNYEYYNNKMNIIPRTYYHDVNKHLEFPYQAMNLVIDGMQDKVTLYYKGEMYQYKQIQKFIHDEAFFFQMEVLLGLPFTQKTIASLMEYYETKLKEEREKCNPSPTLLRSLWELLLVLLKIK